MVGRYETNFIKEVIVRLDYSYPLMKLSRTLPKKIRKIASELFPVSEPKEFVTKELEISKDATKEKTVQGTNWFFHSEDRGKTLILALKNVNISYKDKKYESFDALKQDFLPIVTELFNSYDDLQGLRLGLRYINEIVIPENDVLNWTNYLNDTLLTHLSFPEDATKICRAFNNLELKEGDMILQFRYGIFNPDYPATIQKKSFILDYDASHKGAINSEDIAPMLDKFNTTIKAVFEHSIKDGLRSLMRVLNDG